MGMFDSYRPQRPLVKVCMMGPKAVGKTTVLTAVFNETQHSIIDTSLNLTAKGDTNAELISRLHMLNAIFAKKKEIVDNSNLVQDAGIAASSTESRFDFAFGHLGKDPIIDLAVKDFPGEKVVKEQEDVIRFIEDSHCIFIAIDTPHLMERNGEFNDVKNKPAQITNLFKKALSVIKSEKLVILIPLKCEKYFNEQRMQEVLAKVLESYKELIGVLGNTGKICCCISPILTLGDVEFDSFSVVDGQVTLAPDGCPAGVKYKYVGKGKYSPLFCSQPLYAMLSFVAAQYKRSERKMSLIELLKNMLWKTFNSDRQLFEDILKMEKNRISDNEKLGYKVVCGAELFHYNH